MNLPVFVALYLGLIVCGRIMVPEPSKGFVIGWSSAAMIIAVAFGVLAGK